MLRQVERLRVISREIRRLRDGHVRRIEVHEIPALGGVARLLEVFHGQLHPLQRVTRGSQPGLVQDTGHRLVVAEGHVEFTAPIDAVQPVVTGAVQVNEPSSARARFDRPPGSDLVVNFFAVTEVEELLQLQDHRVCVVTQRAVHADQVRVHVAQAGLVEFAPADQGKKDRSAPRERLVVLFDAVGKGAIDEGQNRFEKLAFATGPLQDRLYLGSRMHRRPRLYHGRNALCRVGAS